MLFKYSDPDIADYDGAQVLFQNFKQAFLN